MDSRGWLARLKTVKSDLADFERLHNACALLCTEHKLQLPPQVHLKPAPDTCILSSLWDNPTPALCQRGICVPIKDTCRVQGQHRVAGQAASSCLRSQACPSTSKYFWTGGHDARSVLPLSRSQRHMSPVASLLWAEREPQMVCTAGLPA